MRLPTVIIRDVLKVNSDEDIVRSLRTQNRHLSEGLDWEKPRAVSSPDKAGFVYVGLKGARYGTSPRWYSVRAVSDTDMESVLQRSVREVRALRRGAHWRNMPGERMESPKMRKLYKGRLRRHRTWSVQLGCGVRAKWDDMARSKEPYIGNIGELRRYPGCRVVKRRLRGGPVKAAIMVLNSDVDVEEDQTLNGENVAAAVIKAGNCRIGVVSVYFEETCPSARTSIACDTSAQNSGPTKSSWGRCQRVECMVGQRTQ
ncbi:hypothetical protein EVAR_90910_1 [Eumeta japonica]|uniref:Uncharacterized protein n=1 Tax=Eumeta variegata TaxID=151549 RepID=A0A4C2A0W7_EUMVA|nr:hypothetical protein EVAR_90910_1 [Eumeta japonica]